MTKEQLVNYLPAEYSGYYFCYPSANPYGTSTIKLSATGDYLAISYIYQTQSDSNSIGYTKSGILILKNNGSTYVRHNNFDIASTSCYGGSNSPNNSYCYLHASDDFSVIATANILYDYSPNVNSYSYTYNYVLTGSPDSYTLKQINSSSIHIPLCALSKDGSCAVFIEVDTDSSGDNSFYYNVYSIDKNSNSVTKIGGLFYRNYYQVAEDIVISADNHIWLIRQSNSTTGEVARLEHGKVENGVFTKLTSDYMMTDGNGNYLYTSYSDTVSGSSYTYNGMFVDVKNNLLYIASRHKLYVCSMTKGSNGSLSSYTLINSINNVSSYSSHSKVAITPNLVM